MKILTSQAEAFFENAIITFLIKADPAMAKEK
ncbi:hypothetical protein SAMN05216167_1485 [Spirosoma endophyticum]|uniref:Uncharacterized protein n=1 Tax=Spirosoma endophyticum TaxID=662367 RepID=A0A1I2HT59_9BACT|nr:hypothetical protein SAMN05216167_1485 [Spirosoma endophyticum]